MEEKKLTSYPSIDRPWLKYYSEEAINTSIPQKSMYDLIYESNKQRLNNTAIRYYGNDVSYGELFQNIERAASAFSAYGIAAGDVVTILSLNTPETAYAIYALNRIGAVANLIVVNASNNEIRANLIDTNSKLFLVLDKILDGMGDFECPIPVVVLPIAESAKGLDKLIFKLIGSNKKKSQLKYWEFVRKAEALKNTTLISCDAPAVIVYTSGTTGMPKGVVLSNKNLNSCAIQCAASGKNYQPNETFLNILPPFYSFGIGMKHLCLYVGMTEIPMLIPKVNLVIKMVKKHKPNRFVIGPALTDVIEKYQGDNLSFLVDLTGGGGSISDKKEYQLNAILKKKHSKSKYLSGYGMTELSAAVSMNYNEHYKHQSIGLPLPLTNIRICDSETGVELGYGQEGELQVDSPSLMLGYYKNVDATCAAILTETDGTRWMRTGDLAKVDEDGFLYITGRLKRIYIVTDQDNMAYKLFPQRMEEVIQQISGVVDCGVIVQKDTQTGYIPIVFISPDAKVVKEELKEAVANTISENLPAYYKPKAIFILDKMPVNNNQKIDYRELEHLAAES